MPTTCKRCAGWRPLAGLDRGWGVCGRVSSPDRPTNQPFTVVVIDGLLETAELLTHETFGCHAFTRRLKRIIHSDIVYDTPVTSRASDAPEDAPEETQHERSDASPD